MIDLKEVAISDMEWAVPLLKSCNLRGSEYTFANLFNWSTVYSLRIAKVDNWLIMRSGGDNGSFSFPAGTGELATVMDAMEEYCKSNDKALVIYGISSESKALMEARYPNRFVYTPTPNNFDYIYSREELSNLAGKPFHSKRNHVSGFKTAYPNWSYEPITEANIPEVKTMNTEWCRINGCHESHSLQREYCAVKSAFDHFTPLGLKGALIRVDGNIVAFTMGSEVTADTFVIHVEKAFSDVRGAYPIINQQFILNELSAYEYINREDDLGEPGLRKAKLSYRPKFMYERFVAREDDKK